jgi:hypothetical protein
MRWSLVLCLADPSSDVPPDELVRCLRTLAHDDHMWVQRELAIAIPTLVDDGGLDHATGEEILALVRDRLPEEPADTQEEVEPFLQDATRRLGLSPSSPTTSP